MEQNKYLEYLAELYPTIEKASTEIINLQSIINLPKGTEHFLSDIHGEYEAFSHVLRNGSGAVRKKIDAVSILQNVQISVPEAQANHRRNTCLLSGCGSHPEDVMISPLNIQ